MANSELSRKTLGEAVDQWKREACEALVKDFMKQEKMLTLRIRDGFIGKELDGSGYRLQLERGKPRGTMVAIKGGNSDVFIGHIYLKPGDKDVPAVGQFLALMDAVACREHKNPGEEILLRKTGLESADYLASGDGLIHIAVPEHKKMKNVNDRKLEEFFRIRALCYFWPDVYSHTRGSDKIVYPNYERIHRNRERALELLGR